MFTTSLKYHLNKCFADIQGSIQRQVHNIDLDLKLS